MQMIVSSKIGTGIAYNFITIKIARYTRDHCMVTHPLLPTPFLSVEIDFCDLHIFRVGTRPQDISQGVSVKKTSNSGKESCVRRN